MEYSVQYRKKDKGIQGIINYKDNNGIWRQKSKQGFATKKEAKKYILKLIKELEISLTNERDLLNYDYFETTLKGVYNSFEHHMKLYRSQDTLDGYKYAFNKFSDLHDLKVKEIKKINIQTCIDEMLQYGVKASSIETYIKKIKQVFLYYKENYNE